MMCRLSLITWGASWVIFVLVVGCAQTKKPAGTPVANIWETPGQPSASSIPDEEHVPMIGTQPAGDGQAANPAATETAKSAQAIARINGAPITRSMLTEMLIESHGLSLLEQLILLFAARQRAAEMSLKVTPADVAAAHEEALRRLATPIGESQDASLDRQAARRLLEEFLLAKNISQREWDLRMEQRAYLTKIAETEVAQMEVTEQMLREEYALAYGERVQIRHIQVSSLESVTRAKALLAEKKDFELVARQLSENPITAARGGLVPPFTRNDPSVTPLLREKAFEMSVGEISPAINEANTYHIIRLERRFPASNVGFDNVDHEALRQSLLKRLTRQRQNTLEDELFSTAEVEIIDKVLSRQYRQKYSQSNR